MAGERKSQSGEERLIELFRPMAKNPGAFALLDDAAVVAPPPGSDVVLKTDAIVGGVHFFHDDPADAVAKKALRVNLSDLAAKGAEPLGFLLTLLLPAEADEKWAARFARGLAEDAEKFRCPLFGGDTDRTPGPITISIAAFGHVPRGKMVRRAGAKPGDLIVVTGTIGDAALGLMLRREPGNPTFARLDSAARSQLADRYLLPQPRNAIALAIREHASASIDVSDGLAGDLTKLAAVSGVVASLNAKLVPLSDGARAVLQAEPKLIEQILSGGDDYEIAATVPENRLGALQAAASAAGIGLTTIGRIEQGEGIAITGLDGKPLTLRRGSYSHF
jgi:thiamine-monophosphate kinase